MKTLIATCLVVFLANIAFAAQDPNAAPAAKQLHCPKEDPSGQELTAEERDLVLTEGPLVVEGRKASACLQRIINREKQNVGSTEKDSDFLVGFMSAVWKAEYEQIEHPY